MWNFDFTCSEIDSRWARFDFQNSISVDGNGSRPSSNGCAESFFNTSRIWCDHSITTDSTAWTNFKSIVSPLSKTKLY